MTMLHIKAKDRIEVDGRTVIFVPKTNITTEEYLALLDGERLTFEARNENKGWHQRNIDRNIMIPTEVRETPTGYNVFIKIDHEALPVSRRELDGSKY